MRAAPSASPATRNRRGNPTGSQGRGAVSATPHRSGRLHRWNPLPIALVSALLLGGCASAPTAGGRGDPVFYPPPPAPPRVQYLTSISSSSDVPGGRNWFASFILGKEEDLPILKPYGLGFWKDRIYVCDTAIPALIVIDLKEKRFRYLAAAAAARISKPINIAIDENGTKYVADTMRGMLVFDADDRWLGELPVGGGVKPSDIAISGNRLYVADLKDSRVVVLDKTTRKQLFSIPRDDESSAQARLYSPVNLAVDGKGNLYVSDMGAFRVQEYDGEGRFLRSFGSPGDAPGQFARPKGIAVDDAGLVYVVDAAAQAVQIFDPEGRLLLYFGEPRESDMPLSLPASIRLDKALVPYFAHFAEASFKVESLAFVSSQYGDHKIAVFGIGR